MDRCLRIDEEIFLNQFTQNIHSLETMNEWFESYDKLDKKVIMRALFYMVVQAHPTYEDLESSVEKLQKRKSPSAVKLLNKNKPFCKYGYEICDLPERELTIGFDIFLLTLAVADTRRRNSEKEGECNHWWHKDLSNEITIDGLPYQMWMEENGAK